MTWAPVKRSALAGLIVWSATTLSAQETGEAPLSAIGWLSDSIAMPQTVAPPNVPPAQTTALVPLTVAPLDTAVPDTAGVFTADDLGVDRALWARNSAAELAAALADMPEITLPGLRDFYVRLLAARLDAPADAILNDAFFLARVDTLMGLARFDLAGALLSEAGTDDPERFRRFFDIGLLTGTEMDACAIIDDTPEVSPTFPTRIFCLARNGDWDVAALTLGTAEALGMLSEQEDQLLLRFLDPDLFEDDPVPAPDGMSPLLFRLYEAIGERPVTDQLPVAFAVTDLSQNVGWKDRLHAAERLAVLGAIAPDDLMEIMRARRPAASGGVWSRVRALQTFDAVPPQDTRRFADALSAAWDAASDAGYAATLAPWFMERIGDVTLPSSAHHAAFQIALVSGRIERAKAWGTGREDDRIVLETALGAPFQPEGTAPLETAIRQSLAGLRPSPGPRGELQAGRTGSTLLDAIAALAPGAEGDPRAIGDALAVLVALGLDDLARRVSVELLLDASRI